ncbi:MAG: 30S ribosomal protein S8 [Planctomycetota bacterium]
MMTDPIADMLTRIRNANSIGRKQVEMPASRMRVGIANVLKEEGFIQDYSVAEGKPSSTLHVTLRYGLDGEKVIRSIQRVSKPGRRAYAGIKELKPVLRGQGIAVLSTPKGVLSDRKARELNVGGELLAEVY